jgi:DNA-binding NtrC family response regulator
MTYRSGLTRLLVYGSNGYQRVMTRILVVDDEPNIRRLVSAILRQQGYSVTEAADARMALAALDQERFDLVISDLHMPGLSGIALTKRIRSRDPVLPILIMSGDLDEAYDALTARATAFLPKPFARDRLLKAVRRLQSPAAV